MREFVFIGGMARFGLARNTGLTRDPGRWGGNVATADSRRSVGVHML